MKRLNVLVVITLLFALSMGTVVSAEGIYGGTVKIAVPVEVPNLDIQLTAHDGVSYVAQHMYEQLFAFNEAFGIEPMLAESYEINAEGTVYTIYLRKGVPFHNGKEMTAEDVIASLNRWGVVSSRGATSFKYITSIDAPDPYTVVITLDEPFAPLLAFLAFQNTAASILPKELAEKYPTTPLAEHIGTGPYKFVHWLPDYCIRLERFDDYAARDDEPSGWAGRKVAYLDAIEYYTVTEDFGRQAGVQGGDYHVGMTINREAYPQLSQIPNILTHRVSPGGFGWIIFNKKEGNMTNQAWRQAALASMDMDPLMAAAYGQPEFYSVEASYYPANSIWGTEVGGEFYDENNIERARQLLKDSGYNNEPIRLIVAGERPEHLNIAMVAASFWKEAGLNVDLQLYDWATVLDRRVQPAAYEAFVTGHGFVPDPSLVTVMSSAYAGWWDSPRKNELVAKFQSEPNLDARIELWNEIQTLIYEEVPVIRVGTYYQLIISTTGLQNFVGTTWPVLWNVWFE